MSGNVLPAAAPRMRRSAHATGVIASLVALLFVLALLCAPLSPLFDPDEGYYPATAEETLRSGPFWDLRFNGAPRWDKPILSYALIELALSTLGDTVTAARVPSAIEEALLVATVGILVARLASPRAGILSATVVGTTLGVAVFSRVAHPELALVTSVVVAELLFCVWVIESNDSKRGASIGAGVAIALGLLAKGPVAALLPLLAVVCALPFLQLVPARLRSLVTGAGLAAAVAVTLAIPWYVTMTVRYGMTFLREAVWQQNVGRYTSDMYGHLSNATVLILPTVAALFPWAGLLPQALWRVSPRNKGPREILRMTMCVSAVTALTFYSLSSSKLPSYALVAVPPLGILIGLWLDDDIDASKPSRTGWIQTTTLLGVVATVLLSAPLWVGALVTARQLFGAVRPQQSDVAALLAPITFPLGGLFAAAAIALLWFKRPAGRVIAVATLGALAPVVLLFCGQPILRSMYPWEALSAKVEPGHGHIWLVGRRAPSLTFYAHQPVSTIASIESLERVVQWEHEGWIALTREDWAQFATTEPATEAHATLVAEGGRIVLARFRH